MPNYVQAQINQRWQIGQEASLGAGGAAGKKLQSVIFVPTEELGVAEFKSPGHRFTQGVEVEKEWTSFTFSGAALYTEVLYFFEALFGAGALTTPGGATIARQRIYTPSLSGPITPKSLVMQWGDSNNVNIITYGMVSELIMKYDREAGVTISGTGFGQKQTSGGTFTATPTFLAKKPILGKHLNYYLDTTGASIGTTQQQLAIMSAQWTWKNGFMPYWDSDRAQPSWAVHVDGTPVMEVTIDFVENANTRTLNNNLVAGNVYFFRINAQDSVNSIETAEAYTLNQDFALQLVSKQAYGNKGEVLFRTFTFRVIEDLTWAQAMQITSITGEASL